jgi:Glycosyltransferases involved in cell wall biogenesis
MKLLIIVPAYNERENIERVIDHLIQDYPQYSYVVVNDGSKDDTAQICRRKGYNLIDLPVNLGLAGGFQAGMQYAEKHGFDYAIQYDADGQHRAEYIGKLLEECEKGQDIVIGSRFAEKKKPLSLRMLGSRLISGAIRITTFRKIKDPTSGMRVYNRRMIELFAHHTNLSPEPDSVAYMIKSGAKVSEVQVEMDERIAGISYLNAPKAMFYMLRMVVSILFIQVFRSPVRLKKSGPEDET